MNFIFNLKINKITVDLWSSKSIINQKIIKYIYYSKESFQFYIFNF